MNTLRDLLWGASVRVVQRSKAVMLNVANAILRAIGQAQNVIMETRYDVVCYGPDGRIKWRDTAFNRVVIAGLDKLLDATFKNGLTTPAWYVALVGASISDAAITAAATTLTSATNPFTAADAGRAIIVRGAGADGGDLVTTIASYTSAGSVEVTAAAGTTVTGAKATWDARAADVMSSHAPWVEVTAYDQANRPAFTPGTIANGSVSNTDSQATFTMSTNNTLVFGLFLSDNNTKGGSTGVLYGMAPFTTSARQLNDGDSLAVTATLTAASA